eukprot:CAMPEP_0115838674 /NCGR_PEP_ID=MMETSP0287-20121206/5853_1 /TAXON_ID=412157 /ORGANISM="Chrysochromulina rotalis, Strain UIO044" /LENGTH=83 /DNA_ID=CAMNT_0003292213 /DNA_START=165 /DNA_END=416 /DNA_ORIENTATION=+
MRGGWCPTALAASILAILDHGMDGPVSNAMISACEAADRSMQQTRLNESLSVLHEGSAPSQMRSIMTSVSGGRHLHAWQHTEE